MPLLISIGSFKKNDSSYGAGKAKGKGVKLHTPIKKRQQLKIGA
jgi:hypothetical protein